MFYRDKGLKMTNLESAETTTGVASVLDAVDDAVDPHLVRVRNEPGDDSDEEVMLLFSSYDFHYFKKFKNANDEGSRNGNVR